MIPSCLTFYLQYDTFVQPKKSYENRQIMAFNWHTSNTYFMTRVMSQNTICSFCCRYSDNYFEHVEVQNSTRHLRTFFLFAIFFSSTNSRTNLTYNSSSFLQVFHFLPNLITGYVYIRYFSLLLKWKLLDDDFWYDQWRVKRKILSTVILMRRDEAKKENCVAIVWRTNIVI